MKDSDFQQFSATTFYLLAYNYRLTLWIKLLFLNIYFNVSTNAYQTTVVEEALQMQRTARCATIIY